MSLFEGDCLDVMKSFPAKSVDIVLCDLPYGTTACKWDVIIPFKPLWVEYKRLCKGAIILFSSQPFTSHLIVNAEIPFKYAWVWDKVKPCGHLVAKKRPMQRTEDICVFGDGAVPYYPQMTKREKPVRGTERKRTEIMGGESTGFSAIYTEKYPQNVLVFSNVQKDKFHPTQKSVALLEYLIRTYTKEGETVLDNTMGSGSTGVACANTRREFIGVEQDSKYFQIAKSRIEGALARKHAEEEKNVGLFSEEVAL